MLNQTKLQNLIIVLSTKNLICNNEIFEDTNTVLKRQEKEPTRLNNTRLVN